MGTDEKKQEKRDSSIIGEMTGSHLHEFNNVLQGIIGLAEMLDADPSLPEKARVGMKAIRRLGQNATKMVQSLGTSAEADRIKATDVPEIKEATDAVESDIAPKATKSILVAEDDQLVRNVVMGMLKYLGYHTIGAPDGIDALEIFKTQNAKIGLVISDLVMPRMGGLELAKEILTVDPSAKVVIMTGYFQEDIDVDADALGLSGWLEKPMTAERLRQIVEPMLKPQEK